MRNPLFRAALGALVVALAAGCGGGGSSSGSSDSTVGVLLTDAPLISVNGRTFSELNVDVTAFEASVPGARTFTAVPFTAVGATVTSVNLLDLNNDQEWLAVAAIPSGRYDQFRITVDPTTAHMIESGTGTRQDLVVRNPAGQLTFVATPPLVVDPASPTLFVIDWMADRSVHYEAGTGEYRLSGVFHAFSLNRQSAPVSFRALPGKLASVDAASGEMRVRLERHSAAQYLVRTNPTGTTPAALVDEQGNALQITDFQVGDRVLITGTVDGNTDVDATRVRRLPASAHAQGNGGAKGGHGGGNPGGGTGGGNPGGGHGGSGSATKTVFAMGVVQRLNATSNEFILATSHSGQIAVVYDDARIYDARVRPPQPTNDNALTPTPPATRVLVEVVGTYVAPATAGGLATIDARGQNGAPGKVVVIGQR